MVVASSSNVGTTPSTSSSSSASSSTTDSGGGIHTIFTSNNRSHNNNNSTNQQQEVHNPILAAYESFVNETPLATRWVLLVHIGFHIVQLLSFGIARESFFNNIPYEIIHNLQIHRLFTNTLVGNDIFSLLFACIGFGSSSSSHGNKLERNMGSIIFAYTCCIIVISINVLYVLLTYLFHNNSVVDNAPPSSVSSPSCSGLWILLFATLSMECYKDACYDHDSSNSSIYEQRKRTLYFIQVPTIYYPFALCFLFGLFVKNVQFVYVISIFVGYLFGWLHFHHDNSVSTCGTSSTGSIGINSSNSSSSFYRQCYTKYIQLNIQTVQQWEQQRSLLSVVSQRKGYVRAGGEGGSILVHGNMWSTPTTTTTADSNNRRRSFMTSIAEWLSSSSSNSEDRTTTAGDSSSSFRDLEEGGSGGQRLGSATTAGAVSGDTASQKKDSTITSNSNTTLSTASIRTRSTATTSSSGTSLSSSSSSGKIMMNETVRLARKSAIERRQQKQKEKEEITQKEELK